ncbi:WhiB family transcriptional regulator [Nonomuraea sp. NPDC049158]|uniref:WhiB family transcriptional regulator n=1 Tax=Nonomuraea sp. NPDC049158 TaxID=3155649 RepID=UPI0033F45DAE
MAHNTNRPIHPARMSLAEVEATWRVDGETPLPECTYDPELHTGLRLTIESTEERAAREAVAREVCGTCPALLFCALYALETRPATGIWAGQTPAEIAAHAAEVEDLEVA